MTTGQRIKAARKAAGMTQKELGEKLGLSFQSIAQWENDLRNPKIDTLKRIATVLGVSWYELYSDSPQEQANAIKADLKAQLVYSELKGKLQIGTVGSNNFRDATQEDLFDSFMMPTELRSKYTSLFDRLNLRGQQVAVKRVEELTEIPRYRRQDAPQPPPQSSEGKDTTRDLTGSDEAQSPSDGANRKP